MKLVIAGRRSEAASPESSKHPAVITGFRALGLLRRPRPRAYDSNFGNAARVTHFFFAARNQCRFVGRSDKARCTEFMTTYAPRMFRHDGRSPALSIQDQETRALN